MFWHDKWYEDQSLKEMYMYPRLRCLN